MNSEHLKDEVLKQNLLTNEFIETKLKLIYEIKKLQNLVVESYNKRTSFVK